MTILCTKMVMIITIDLELIWLTAQSRTGCTHSALVQHHYDDGHEVEKERMEEGDNDEEWHFQFKWQQYWLASSPACIFKYMKFCIHRLKYIF